MTTGTDFSALDPLQERLLEVLGHAPAPVPIGQILTGIRGLFRIAHDELAAVLEAGVAKGWLYRFAPYRSKQLRYWTQDETAYARAFVLELLAAAPLGWPEIRRRAASPLKGVAEKRLRRVLDELKTDGRLYELPPLLEARTKRFSAGPPEPLEYLAQALEKVRKKLKPFALPEDRFAAALRELAAANAPAEPPQRFIPEADADTAPAPQAPPTDPLALLVEGMLQLDPRARFGEPILLRELRWRLAPWLPKEQFDRAVFQLAERGTVHLQRHDFPSSLSEEERQQLVTDGRGNYFLGITLRTGHEYA